MRTKRSAVLALAASAALAIGVTAAWAGFPNMRQTDSTLEAGTITTKGGKGTTATRTLLAASASGASLDATIYVHFLATGVTPGTTFQAFANASQTWACANSGGGWPTNATKVELTAPVDGTTLEPFGVRNGRLNYQGDELAVVLSAPSLLVCPSGQTALLVGLTLNSLTIRVFDASGESRDYAANVPTSAGWVGNVWERAGYPG